MQKGFVGVGSWKRGIKRRGPAACYSTVDWNFELPAGDVNSKLSGAVWRNCFLTCRMVELCERLMHISSKIVFMAQL